MIPVDVLQSALAAASEAALQAGAIMKECYQLRFAQEEAEAASARGSHGAHSTEAHTSGAVSLDICEKASNTDLVTKYDKQCDALITEKLTQWNAQFASRFSFKFITEELAPEGPLTNDPTWIVDPIDGTMSFVHKSFDCCVSIGLAVNKIPVLGVVYCPFLGNNGGELYTAVEGCGAFMNGKPIHVSKCEEPTRAIVFFNMPWRMAAPAIESSIGIRRELAQDGVRAIRSYGACVLQLAQVACGRGDLYMETGGKMWDVCAGVALIKEAGGTVLNLDGSPFSLEHHRVTVASSLKLAEYGATLCRKYNLEAEYYR